MDTTDKQTFTEDQVLEILKEFKEKGNASEKKIDPKKLIIYSEIMKPRFEE